MTFMMLHEIANLIINILKNLDVIGTLSEEHLGIISQHFYGKKTVEENCKNMPVTPEICKLQIPTKLLYVWHCEWVWKMKIC